MPFFSIITATHDRRFDEGKLGRCVDSVQTQVFDDFEHIIVDDGSTDCTEEFLASLEDKDPRFRSMGHPEARGRVAARNTGMATAKGEWLVWLDSDDALDPMYLKTLAYNIDKIRRARVFTIGAVVHGVIREKELGLHSVPKWTLLRQAWLPERNEDPDKAWRHAPFPSGKIGTGMFAFHANCLKKVGLMPPWVNHYEIADGIDEWLGYETGYSAAERWVGNPNGEDHAFFHKLAQHYVVRKIDACLYVQYVR